MDIRSQRPKRIAPPRQPKKFAEDFGSTNKPIQSSLESTQGTVTSSHRNSQSNSLKFTNKVRHKRTISEIPQQISKQQYSTPQKDSIQQSFNIVSEEESSPVYQSNEAELVLECLRQRNQTQKEVVYITDYQYDDSQQDIGGLTDFDGIISQIQQKQKEGQQISRGKRQNVKRLLLNMLDDDQLTQRHMWAENEGSLVNIDSPQESQIDKIKLQLRQLLSKHPEQYNKLATLIDKCKYCNQLIIILQGNQYVGLYESKGNEYQRLHGKAPQKLYKDQLKRVDRSEYIFSLRFAV